MNINLFRLGIALAVVYWLLESIVHSYLWHESTLWEALHGAHNINEILMRGIIVGLLIGFGFIGNRLLNRERQAREHTAHVNRLLQFLSDVNQNVQRHTDRQQLFEAACNSAVNIGDFRLAWIGMREDGELKLAVWAVADPALEDVIRMMQEPLALGGCLGAQKVLRQGECTLCELRGRVDCHVPWLSAVLEQGCEHAVAMPLKIGEETVGVFEVYAGKDGKLKEDERAILEEVADDLSVAMTNIEHEKQRRQDREKLQQRLEELERFQRATVQREFRIKELRDELDTLEEKLASFQSPEK
jgi:transcriptional regulator with GAF, ATPase, and Fis domain